MEVSTLVDDATVGVVRVVEVVDVVGATVVNAFDVVGSLVVVRGADVVDLVELEGCADVVDVADVVVTGATVLEVRELVGVSLASCSRSFSRLALASARARFALSTCRLAKMRSFVLAASFSVCSAFFNVASASATMRSPSSTVEGFGGATYSGATMYSVLGTCEDVGDGFEVAVFEVDGVVSGAIVTVTVGASEVVGVVGVVEVTVVVGSGRTLGTVGSGGRSGKDGWLGAEVVGVVEVDEEDEVVGVGFGRSEVVVVTTGGKGEGSGDGSGVGVGFWRRLLRRMRISASRGWGSSPGFREFPETMRRSSQLCASAIAWPISCAMVMMRLFAPTVGANICGLIRTVRVGPPPVTRPSTGRLGSTITLTASGVLWSMNLMSRYPPRSRTALTHRFAARWMSARWPVVS